MTTSKHRSEPISKVAPAKSFRPDVEGLRAIAVGLVVLYHAGVTKLSGGFVGVDVFFVISGFLITGLLLNEFEKTGTVSLLNFYARRAKRLLPAACLVLVVTAILSRAVLPKYDWDTDGGDIVSAAAYVVNWRLAARSVDYLAEDVAPSPVQHYWSLAVEEQFYIVWPLLLVVVGLLARRFGYPRRFMVAGLSIIAITSFAYSVSETDHNPARAFFVTPTRMWELAVGAFVAVGVKQLPRIPRRFAIALGWAGVAAIAVAGFRIDAQTAWPGWHAAIPVLGSAAVIAAGPAAGQAGPALLLGTRPMVWIGGLSYSLYLWHWPLLIMAAAHYGPLSTRQGLLVAAVSVIPAWVSNRVLENPIRHSALLSRRPRLALTTGGTVTMAGVAAGLVLGMSVPTISGITPDPLRAEQDVPDLYAQGCQQDQVSAEVVSCTYGPADARTTIAVVGDSKIAQWLPALQAVAPQNSWKIVTYTKSACAPADVDTAAGSGLYTSCRAWMRNVIAKLTGPAKPDVILTSQRESRAAGKGDAQRRATMRDGLVATWGDFKAAGIPVVVLGDTLVPPFTVWQCVADHAKDYTSKCSFPRDPAVAGSAGPLLKQAVTAAGGRVEAADGSIPAGSPLAPVYVDLVGKICPSATCPPVIAGVLVYRQGSHLTATFVKTLAPELSALLVKAGVPAAAQ